LGQNGTSWDTLWQLTFPSHILKKKDKAMEKADPANNYHYNPQLQPFANRLRKTMTRSEARLWKYVLSRRQMKGYQFRRQRPVLNFIADFMCQELLLIIEVDGLTHDDPEAVKRDLERDEKLRAVGFTTLRFSSWEVLHQLGDVSGMIGAWIEANGAIPPPGPRQRGRVRRQPPSIE
jgi:very-short-patch-repair endonuclease